MHEGKMPIKGCACVAQYVLLLGHMRAHEAACVAAWPYEGLQRQRVLLELQVHARMKECWLREDVSFQICLMPVLWKL